MLAEEQQVGGKLAGQAVVGEATLEGEGFTVGNCAEIEYGKRVGSQGLGVRGEGRRSRIGVSRAGR